MKYLEIGVRPGYIVGEGIIYFCVCVCVLDTRGKYIIRMKEPTDTIHD